MQPRTYCKALALSFLCLLSIVSKKAHAQLSIVSNRTASQLVQKIVGAGVTYTNATLVCEDTANGTFLAANSNLGIGEGITLTTGIAKEAAGPYSFFASEAHFTPGDADLTTLISRPTHDACKLEFDFMPTGDTVKFRYVFGSEEYQGFSCSNYNDVFAFWISGPGYPMPKNIALIPNTSIAVAINSTTGLANNATCQAMGPGSPFSQYFVNNVGGTTITYSGFTTVLTAIATVIPCQTYHMKLAIADVQDQGYDSGVFLEAGSLTSNQLSVSTAGNLQAPVPYCVRGCKNGELKFERQKVSPLPLTINYLIAGTAVNGTDYSTIPSSVTIPGNATSVTLPIIPLTTATGEKTIKLYVYSPFSCVQPPIIVDSSTVTIYDSIYAQIATPDTGVCPGVAGRLRVVGDDIFTYSWSPAAGLSATNVKSPMALPTSTTTYMMTATLPASTCLPVRDQVTVSINTIPAITADPTNKSICAGSNTSFGVSATGTTLAYRWQVNTGSGYTNITNNTIYSGATTSTLNITSATAGMTGYQYRCVVDGVCDPDLNSQSATLTVRIPPTITTPPTNKSVCENSNTNFSVAVSGNGLTYQWYEDFGSGYFNVNNGGVYSGATSNTLSLTGVPMSMNGRKYMCVISGECNPAATTAQVTLTVTSTPAITTQPVNRQICPANNTSFSVAATGAGITYKWQVNTGSGFTDLVNGGVYTGATTNTLNITNATVGLNSYKYRCVVSGTCTPAATSDEVTLTVNTPPAITSAPSATPICDGGNTTFTVGATGSNLTYQWQVNTGSGYNNISNTGVYSGATTNALSITGVSSAMSGYQYQCVVSGTCPPSVTSGALTLTLSVNTLPAITGQPSNTSVCETGNTAFSVAATGSGIGYQWQVNTGSGFSNISNGSLYNNATTSTLNITGATKAMSGYQYRCVVPGTCLPNAISNAATLRVDTIPAITQQPQNSTVCDGQPTTFFVNATGTMRTYQWQVNTGSGFSNISSSVLYSGANTTTLSLSTATNGMHNYEYRCVVSGTCLPDATSDPAVLKINTLPTINTQPWSNVVCDGGNINFTVGATGTGITYQWQTDNGSGFSNIANGGIYSGATTATLSLTGASLSMNGRTYRCIVSGTCNPPATSSAAMMLVTTAPSITLQPKDSIICDGGNASFATDATGADLTYQWQVNTGSGFNDVNDGGIYSGATTNTLQLTAASTTINGFTYRCMVTGSCPPVATSASADITVRQLPNVNTHPANQVTCDGGNTSFNIAATGHGITYQWQVNNGSGFNNITNNSIYTGATTSTLNLTGAGTALNGFTYRCIVSGTCLPPATSNAGSLTVNILPDITTQPHDSTICDGSNASFAIQAVGTGATYQWQVNTGSGFNNISNNGTYSGSNTNMLSVTAGTVAMSGYIYRCIVNGTCAPNDVSSTAILTVHSLPNITSNPASTTICNGENTSFTITATGTSIHYQWQVNTGSGFTNIINSSIYSGATNSTLNITAGNTGMNGYLYRCVVGGACTPDATSNNATLIVYTLPTITAQPVPSTICTGNSTSFTVGATGTGISYQWQVDNGSGFVNVNNIGIYSGATTNTLTLTGATISVNSNSYRCIVAGTCLPSVISDSAMLFISVPPVIVTPPSATPICDGGDAVFSLGATGTNLVYQWQVNTGGGFVNISNNTLYSGATTNALRIIGVTPSMSGYQYQCIISGDCPPVITSGALTLVLTVYTLPAVTSNPTNRKICDGSNTSFSASGTGTNLTHQWQVDDGTGFANISNGGVYSNATTPTLNITGATKDMSGNKYRCVMPGICLPEAITTDATLTVDTLPNVLLQPKYTTVCDGLAASFTINAEGTQHTYTWQVNDGTGFTNVPNTGVYSGTNTAQLSLSATNAAMHNYQYRCIIAGLCAPTDISDVAILKINNLPAVTNHPSNTTICDGDNAGFTVAATGTNIAYQWQVNTGSGFNNITNGGLYSGATTNALALTAANAAMHGYTYRCVVSGTCLPQANSNPATLTVNTLPDITTQPRDSVMCDGANATFKIAATGTNITYRWQVNTGSGFADISNSSVYSNATTNTLLLTNPGTGFNGYRYRCIVAGACTPSDTTATAQLTVNSLPAVTGNPSTVTICDGDNTGFAITATGTNISYQWQVNQGTGFNNIPNGGIYSGATTNALTLTAANASMHGYTYRCVVSGICLPPANSNPATLNVNTLPDITVQARDSVVCDGSNATFSTTATGTNITYRWQVNTGSGYNNISNGGVYSNATTSTLMLTGANTAMNNYMYRCIVAGTCTPNDTSTPVKLTVNSLPNVTGNPSTVTICDGGNTGFAITATGTNITYQWQVNQGAGFNNIINGGVYSGATTNALTLTAANAAMHGYTYRCVVSGTCLPPASSNIATLNVNTLPDVTVQPKDSTICDGNNATFSITATGTNVTYRWQVNTGTGFNNINNGGAYSNATTNTLLLTGANVPMGGYLYRCIITGTCSPNDTSAQVVLTVNSLPNISNQPQSTTICEFDNTYFGVDATGTGLTYQWQVLTGNVFVDLANTGVYSSVTTDTMRISTVPASMHGSQYRCIVSGTCQPQVVSTTIVLSVKTSPVVISQPEDSVICDGGDAGFDVTVTGSAPIYQWQVNDGTGFTNISNGGMYTGTNTTTLTATAIPVSMNGYLYRCIIAGDCMPSDTSDAALLTVNLPAAITAHPVNSTICETTNTNFTVQATGANLQYQWQVNMGTGFTDLLNGGNYQNVNSSTLDIINASTTMHNYQYRCVITGSCPPIAISNAASLLINTAPDITSEPVNKATCPGEQTTFNVAATGTNIRFLWQVNDGSGYVGLVNSSVYGGVTTNTLAVTPSGVMNGYKYRCVIVGSCLPDTVSKEVILTVHPTVIPTIALNEVRSCKGDSIILTANPGSGITYQWQLNGNDMPGATNRIYYATQDGNYTVTANNTFCTETSSSVALQFRNLPTANIDITSNPVICPDSPVVLVTTGYAKGKYQWQHNGSNIDGANNLSYTTKQPGSYTAIVTDSFGCSITTAATEVEADPGPDPMITISNRIVLCTGNYMYYQWYKDTTAIDISTACFSATDNGTYSVFVTNFKGCSAKSQPIEMNNVGDIILITPNPATTTITVHTEEKVRTTLSTLEGKILIETPSKELDVRHLATGMYMLRVYDQYNNLIKSERIIKQTW